MTYYTITYRQKMNGEFRTAVDRYEWGSLKNAIAAAKEQMRDLAEIGIAVPNARISNAHSGDLVRVVEWGRYKPVARRPIAGLD